MNTALAATFNGARDDIAWFLDEFTASGQDINVMLFRQLFDSTFIPADSRDREHVSILMGMPTPVPTTTPRPEASAGGSTTLHLAFEGRVFPTKDVLCLAALFSLTVAATLTESTDCHGGAFALEFTRHE